MSDHMEKSYFGARYHQSGDCSFRIFAPHVRHAEVTIHNCGKKTERMTASRLGFHELTLPAIEPGTLYSYVLDGVDGVPDPASLRQPAGLRDASVVVDHHFFDWKADDFSGLPMSEMVMYETHVGVFSAQRSFAGIISRLDHLRELGINTLLLMPVASFSGTRSWGYDTVFPYAVHESYGSSEELKELIRECHLRGIAVILDVVFGALTPVNELTSFYQPFFSRKYNSEHGRVLNFDERFSNGVREFYIQCALSWIRDYRVDGLRICDAYAIFDQTPLHFLEELSLRVRDFAASRNRNCVIITADRRNELRTVMPYEKGGYGLDALYNDDFSNALLYRLTGETTGHLSDYSNPRRILSALQYGFAYRGEVSPHYMRLQGRNRAELSGCKFVVHSQSHDPDAGQEECCRIIAKAGFEAAKLSAGITLLSPYVPMIFMGEEYGDPAPFHYFNDAEKHVSHEDCVRPSPCDDSAFTASCLDWNNLETDRGRAMLALYRRLLKIRREHPTIHEPCRSRCQVQEVEPGLVLVLRNSAAGDRRYAAVLLNFNDVSVERLLNNDLPEGVWTTDLYSASPAYGGSADPLPAVLTAAEPLTIAAHSFVLLFYTRIKI